MLRFKTIYIDMSYSNERDFYCSETTHTHKHKRKQTVPYIRDLL